MDSEKKFVERLARALAIANGHSHPDEYAARVADAHVVAEEDKQEPAKQQAPALPSPEKEG